MTETGYAAVQPTTLPFDTPASDGIDPLIGHTPLFCRVREQAERVAVSDEPALIQGEAGTGRTRLARAIHVASARSGAPFVTVDCGHLPEALLDAELFGCLKGSAVGASTDRHGVLDTAHGGTVVLEDIEAMTLVTQGHLLRFLESMEVRPVGSLGPGTPTDVRILATTTVSLNDRVAAGLFRADLRAWLAEHELQVPALRDRRTDIPVLVDYFVRAAARHERRPAVAFSPEAHRALMAYSWPGNVAELRRVVERLVSTAQVPDVGPSDLPVGIRPRAAQAPRRRRDRRRVSEDLYFRLVHKGEDFWSCVYPLFMQREITRADLRDLLRRGLLAAKGSTENLVRLFNMPSGDHKKFLTFLRKYDCLV